MHQRRGLRLGILVDSEASYVIGNVRLGWHSEDNHWEGGLFAENVADERYYTIG